MGFLTNNPPGASPSSEEQQRGRYWNSPAGGRNVVFGDGHEKYYRMGTTGPEANSWFEPPLNRQAPLQVSAGGRGLAPHPGRQAEHAERPGLAPWVPRVTLTLPAINAAAEILFLVTGAEKAVAVERAFAGKPDPGAPASLVAPASGRLTVLLDRPAAKRLPVGRSS